MEKDLEQFGALFSKFLQASLAAKPEEEPEFRTLLRKHLSAEPEGLPVIAEQVPSWNHANLQLALEALFARTGRTVMLVGIGGGHRHYGGLSLSDLLHEHHYSPGSVEYTNLE